MIVYGGHCFPAGHVKPDNSTSLCSVCPMGNYQVKYAQTECIECPVDHFCSVSSNQCKQVSNKLPFMSII